MGRRGRNIYGDGNRRFLSLYNTYDNADEIEKSYEALTKYLAGDISMDDVDFSTHKLLKNDMEAVTKLKKKPYDDSVLNIGIWIVIWQKQICLVWLQSW